MRKKLLLSLLCLGFISPVTILKADEIKLTSTATKEITLSFVTSAVSTVDIDWGTGTAVQYNITKTDMDGATEDIKGTPAGTGEVKITGTGIIVFDCNTSSVTTLDVTGAVNLIKLSFNSNNIQTVDLSQNTALYSLHAETNPGLTSLDLTNNTSLVLLYCYGNNMTALDVTRNTLLTTLNFNDNKIASINLSKNAALKSLYALGNQFESIDVSKNTALTYISLNNNKLTSLDVSANTLLSSLFLANNQMVALTGADNLAATKTVNCSGNKLNLASLPQPGALRTQFTYAPQQAYVLSERILVGQELDLSSQTNVKGVLASPVATTYSWKTESGTALVSGTDYTETNGKFVFLNMQAEKVICTMTTTAFPKFTGTSAFVTTSLAISGATGIGNENKGTKIYPIDNVLIIEGLNGTERIDIINLQGMSVYSSITKSQEVSIPLASGIYIVSVEGKAGKVIIR